jgi:hypothetical protein
LRPAKSGGLRLAGPSQGIAKRVFGVDCNGSEAAELTLVSRRNNNSLSSAGRFLVAASLSGVVVANSLGFAVNGPWLIPPLARLDLLVVGAAFRCMERHAGDYE